jgi:uncharacterized protein YecE (DUF72 family)
VIGESAIRLGTPAFTAACWRGSFYPETLKPADYLSFYATRFDTVELDNMFYRTPSESTVRGWNDGAKDFSALREMKRLF